MDIVEFGVRWLGQMIHTHAGRTVSYRRPERNPFDVVATLGRTATETSEPSGGVRVELSERDYIVWAAAIITGAGSEPLPGDRIVDTDGEYLVTHLTQGQPCWRPTDSYGRMIRIYCKLVT